ncbi:unnamed protein product [Boreogadus saida]
MKALIGLLLLVFGHGVSSVLHSLHYFYTASSGLTTFPEFVVVGMVDGVQMVHFDSVSKKTVLKQDWMEQLTRDNPDYLERSNGLSLGSQQSFKVNIGILKKRFNQTGGTHLISDHRMEAAATSTGGGLFGGETARSFQEQVDPGDEVIPTTGRDLPGQLDLNPRPVTQEGMGEGTSVWFQLERHEGHLHPPDPHIIKTKLGQEWHHNFPSSLGLVSPIVLLLLLLAVGVFVYKKRNGEWIKTLKLGQATNQLLLRHQLLEH